MTTVEGIKLFNWWQASAVHHTSTSAGKGMGSYLFTVKFIDTGYSYVTHKVSTIYQATDREQK